jgi:DtxR family Mn-dependent transcriptional regulator
MSEKKDKELSQISEIPESYQRYLDVIYEISKKKRGGWVSNKEIADLLQVEPASVSGMLEKLKSNNLIKWEPRKSIRLTKQGKQYALELNEIHSLLRNFFKEILQIKDDKIVERISCEIEHHINQDVKTPLKKFLLKYLE